MTKNIKEIDALFKEKEANFQKRKDALFYSPFIGNENVKELHRFAKNYLKEEGDQSKSFVGLVQATLCGKTRYLIELSIMQPMLLISFKKANSAFLTLLKSISINENAIIKDFADRRTHNRRIMLKVRLFYLAYLKFASLFLKARKKQSWEDLVDDEKRILCAMLINGGGKILDNCYKELLEENKIDLLKENELIDYKEEIKKHHTCLSKEFSIPWFAFDECHVPTKYCIGVLFHSDYEDQLHKVEEKKLLEWQMYEQYPQDCRGKPEDYPYKEKTTLFSAFRFISEEYLKNPSTPQMSIFASTYFSSWGTLLDSSKYSREKALIQPFEKFTLIKEKDVEELLKKILVIQKCENIDLIFADEEVKNKLSTWTGRPGFFFENVWSGQWETDHKKETIASFLEFLDSSKRKAKVRIEGIFSDINLRYNSSQYLQKSKEECIDYYLFVKHMRNSEVDDKEWILHLVSAGIALSKEGKALIVEPLIIEYIDKNLSSGFGFDKIEKYLMEIYSEKVDKLAEEAVALRISTFDNYPLLDLIESWKPCTKFNKNIVKGISINAKSCVPFDRLHISEQCEMFNHPIFRESVIFPRTGVRLPDVMFTADDGLDKICLVSIQIKTWVAKLTNDPSLRKKTKEKTKSENKGEKDKKENKGEKDKKENKEETKKKLFSKAIQSTSRPHFFDGHDNQAKKFTNIWEEVIDNKSVLHLRVLICWAGFTREQITAVNIHNDNNPTQPILLVCGSDANALVYGTKIWTKIQSATGAIPRETKHRPVKHEMDVSFLKMDLTENESGWGVDESEEETSEDEETSEEEEKDEED